jgi:hypothetical protein
MYIRKVRAVLLCTSFLAIDNSDTASTLRHELVFMQVASVKVKASAIDVQNN